MARVLTRLFGSLLLTLQYRFAHDVSLCLEAPRRRDKGQRRGTHHDPTKALGTGPKLSSSPPSSHTNGRPGSILVMSLPLRRSSTPNGLPSKHKLRAAVQSTVFLLLVSGYWWTNGIADHGEMDRQLRELVACEDLNVANPPWLCVFYAIGVLYMFLALAICCDEFFVPALEEMSSSRRLNLSMDVAGATLMAAGGSAPELFSSLFGTFQQSSIGFGTIIGSAVFNVLFVIAMCSIFAKEVLQLTWWPLFRDSVCYAIGLIVLSIFVGVTSPGFVELWEAIVLFVLYIAYILIMWKNAAIYKRLTGKELEYPDDEDDDDTDNHEEEKMEAAVEEAKSVDPERPSLEKASSAGSLASVINLQTLQAVANKGHPVGFRWQGTFRAGILKLLRDPESWTMTGGVGIVAKLAGDADQVFRAIDENGDGHIDKDELRKLFDMLDCHVSDKDLDAVFQELDDNGDGVISKEEFYSWYTTSAELIRSQVHHVFDALDVDHSGALDKNEIKALLHELNPAVTDEEIQQAIDIMYKQGSHDEITFEEFEAWYEKSIIYEKQRQAVEEDMEGVSESLKPPCGEGWLAWTQYIIVFPLVLAMVLTIPDVRRPGWGRWCYFAFLVSIAWIGGFSYLMVSWAEIIGNTIGIPSVVMGLTVLAAGTSVPDLLSSVIVARRGSGDMAVSSSIGSNIFDILVGLPIPWILFTAWPTTPSRVVIGAKNIWISIVVLLGMLVFVIGAVHCQKWKLTKTLGAMMLVFYVAFLVQAIVLELPFETCT